MYRNGVGLEVLKKLAPKFAERGWHAQIWAHAPDLPELAPQLLHLGLPLVIDHMGRMNTSHGINHPGFQFLCRLLAEGKGWVKISGADRIGDVSNGYVDVDPFAKLLLAANPENVVWGTDWPHINYFDSALVPDDGNLVNLLSRWIDQPQDLERVLVANPARLYDFPKF
jgi:predicted TIM-barrel fold metal-dependent hydrolase